MSVFRSHTTSSKDLSRNKFLISSVAEERKLSGLPPPDFSRRSAYKGFYIGTNPKVVL